MNDNREESVTWGTAALGVLFFVVLGLLGLLMMAM